MLLETLHIFLAEQKIEWLNKQTKGKEAKPEQLGEANERYDSRIWLAKAIKQSRQGVTTHPGKFTHPDAKTSAILFKQKKRLDGYLTTNNVICEKTFDVFGDAATNSTLKEVYLFLCTILPDNKTIWNHFEVESEESKKLIQYVNEDYKKAKGNFFKIFKDPDGLKTSELLKQVYFPFGNSYHLLSLLAPSIIISELVKRIDTIKFGEDIKAARELRKNNKYHSTGFSEYYDLTQMGRGGAHPKNISILNNQNGGKAYLLPSIPPKLEKREIRLPKIDFFTQCLYRKKFKDNFTELHRFMKLDINNINIRTAISNIISFIIDQVLLVAFRIRQYEAGWSNTEYYASLPLVQRIWLDDTHYDQRVEQNEWREEIGQEIARWVLRAYEKIIQDAYMLGDEELLKIRKMVEEAVKQDKEFF